MRFGITPLEGSNFINVFNEEKGLESFLDFRFSDIILEVIESGYKQILKTWTTLPIPDLPLGKFYCEIFLEPIKSA